MSSFPGLGAPKFSNIFDLARLPYFEIKNARLVLADPGLGPSVDVHTHLGLAFGRNPTIDLTRATPTIELYGLGRRSEDLYRRLHQEDRRADP